MLSNGRLVWFVTLTLGIALATWGFGWWAVVVLAAAWTWIRRGDVAVPLLAALAGALAWGGMLVVQDVAGAPMTRVAGVVGTAMQVGPVALVVLTVAFPALLAGATAGVVRGVSALVSERGA